MISSRMPSWRVLAMCVVFAGLVSVPSFGCRSAPPLGKGLSGRAPVVAVVMRGAAEDVAVAHARCINARAFSRDVAARIRNALDVECRLCRRDTYSFDLVVAHATTAQGAEVQDVRALEPHPYAAPDRADEVLSGLFEAISLPRLPNDRDRCVLRVTVTWPYP